MNGRARVQYWEVWNEPEIATFWEPTLVADPDSFFDMAIATLVELDGYRNTTADANGQAIRIGLGSFVFADTAVATIQSFDPVNIPMDFISFHGYNDDPLVLVDAIGRVATARDNSTNYRDIELVFAEWGPDLATRAGDQQYAETMDPSTARSDRCGTWRVARPRSVPQRYFLRLLSGDRIGPDRQCGYAAPAVPGL